MNQYRSRSLLSRENNKIVKQVCKQLLPSMMLSFSLRSMYICMSVELCKVGYVSFLICRHSIFNPLTLSPLYHWMCFRTDGECNEWQHCNYFEIFTVCSIKTTDGVDRPPHLPFFFISNRWFWVSVISDMLQHRWRSGDDL